jgi:hypothetical protein
LIGALRETAARLGQATTVYRWSHFAHCNCGHLAQTVTQLAPPAIYQAAMREVGDWGEQARTVAFAPPQPDYGDRPALDEGAWEPPDVDQCPVARRSMDRIFAELFAWGLEPADMGALERLSDSAVRRRLGTNTVDYAHGERSNVIAYLLAWADLLEEQLARDAHAPASQPGGGAAHDSWLPLAAE